MEDTASNPPTNATQVVEKGVDHESNEGSFLNTVDQIDPKVR